MKVRVGFVTNSSSTCFVVIGRNDFEDWKDDAIKHMLSNKRTYDILKDNKGRFYKSVEDWLEDDPIDAISNLGFSVGGIDELDMVGIDVFDLIGNPEFSGTHQEICDKIAKKMNDVFGTNFSGKDMEYIREAWRDG